MSNKYPFITKNQIKEKLENDAEFRIECLGILVGYQTQDELEVKASIHKNKRGLRSSEAVFFPTYLANVRAGRAMPPEDHERFERIIPVYAKQLAAHFREIQIAESPELSVVARTFGV